MDVYLSMEWQSLNMHPLAERNVFASCVLFHIHPWQGHEPWMYNQAWSPSPKLGGHLPY